MAEFYSARSWEIPPLPWTNLSPPFSIVLCERHLRRLLGEYADYYNAYRTHHGLAKDTPLGRPVQTSGRIIAVPKLGGLHHAYVRT